MTNQKILAVLRKAGIRLGVYDDVTVRTNASHFRVSFRHGGYQHRMEMAPGVMEKVKAALDAAGIAHKPAREHWGLGKHKWDIEVPKEPTP